MKNRALYVGFTAIAVLVSVVVGIENSSRPMIRAPSAAVADMGVEVVDNRSEMGCVVVIGASYAEGWGEPALGFGKVINKGIGGDESSGMLARFHDDVLSVSPDVVLVWGFINDIFRAPRDRVEERLEQTVIDFRQMVSMAREADVTVVVGTELTIRNKKSFGAEAKQLVGGILGKESYQDFINGHVIRTNQWLRSYAEDESLMILDFEAQLSAANGMRRRVYSADDGSHISKTGYDALTEYASGQFSANLSVIGVSPVGDEHDCTSADH